MPIFEYLCNGCSKVFEKIIRNSQPEKIECPLCGSSDTQKKFSLFASSGSSGHSHSSGSSCSSCSGHNCSSCH